MDIVTMNYTIFWSLVHRRRRLIFIIARRLVHARIHDCVYCKLKWIIAIVVNSGDPRVPDMDMTLIMNIDSGMR
jgi:hypothetical protein